MRRRLAVALAVAAVLGAASCGDDDAATSATTTEVAAPLPPTTGDGAAPVPTVGIDDACALVPTADVAAASGLAVDDGVPAGDPRRRVCTFRAPGVGITVGVQGGGRFDEKAEASRRALDDEGEAVEGVGDRALFFFSDEDLPEGVGGTLVGVGDLTVEVTMQGLGEDAMRTASTGIARLAVGHL